MMRYYYAYETLVGMLWFHASETSLTGISFGPGSDDETERETPLIRRASEQVMEYLRGTRVGFDIPLAPEGTPFQKKVWAFLLTIPHGQTRTYKQVAIATGNPRACRAVGMANNRNPIPIIIPCHRVIGSNGKLVGYAGSQEVKRWLLEREALTL